MSIIQQRRMEGIESWKRKAFSVSKTDRIGLLVLHTLDAIQGIVRDGLSSETLYADLDALKEEHSTTMNTDFESDEDLRAMLYGVSWSVGSLIEVIIDNQNTLIDNAHNWEEDGVEMIQEFMGDGYAAQNGSALPKSEFPDIKTEIKEEEIDDNYPTVMSQSPPIKEEPIEDPPFPAACVSRSEVKEEEMECHVSPTGSQDNGTITDDDDDSPDYAPGYIENEPSGSRKPLPVIVKRKRPNPTATGEIFTCAECGRDFDTERGMNSHAFVHDSTKCDFCGIRIKDRNRLVQHCAEYHPDEPTPLKKKARKDDTARKEWKASYPCEYCEATFQYPSKLAIHIRTHTGEKPFGCPKCPETFTRTDNLKEHLRFKHGEKHYACKYCGEMFALRGEMNKHIDKNHHVYA